MSTKSTVFLLLVFTILLSSCFKQEAPRFNVMGTKPMYKAIKDLEEITNLDPKITIQSGPIFLLDSLFFMTENKKGIHVYNIADSTQIRNLTFIQIPAITDFTIEDNYLYADSWRDLVTIDITDIYNVKLLSRQTDVFEPLLYPILYRGFFECVDESQGAVVGWENELLENALCQTFNQ